MASMGSAWCGLSWISGAHISGRLVRSRSVNQALRLWIPSGQPRDAQSARLVRLATRRDSPHDGVDQIPVGVTLDQYPLPLPGGGVGATAPLMLPTMLGWIAQWKLPLTNLAGVVAPGGTTPKSAELSSMTIWCVLTVSLFLNITWPPLATWTGSGTNEALPNRPTIETVVTAGVVGVVGVDAMLLPPLHADAETAAANTVVTISADRIGFSSEKRMTSRPYEFVQTRYRAMSHGINRARVIRSYRRRKSFRNARRTAERKAAAWKMVTSDNGLTDSSACLDESRGAFDRNAVLRCNGD